MEILEVAQKLSGQFSEDNYILSPQSFALMLEEAKGTPYTAANYLVANSLINKEFSITEKGRNNIIFGNLPKKLVYPLPSIYNNIIYFNSGIYETEEQEDTYLSKMVEMFDDIMTVEWFEKDDIPVGIIPPTFRHLYLLLESFGHKKNRQASTKGNDK